MLNTTFIREVGPFKWAVRYGARQFSKRVLKRDNRLKLPTGLTIHLSRSSGNATEIYVTGGNIDWGSEALFTRFASPEQDFLDIGAHIGYYSVYLAPRVRRVYAFEPDERNLPALRSNAALSANIEIVQKAVSSHDGVAEFTVGHGSEVGTLEAEGGPTVSVPTITVDTFVDQRPEINIGLIKTDIEGHDIQALKGMERTVVRFQPLIVSECGDAEGLRAICRGWGYKLFAYERRPGTMKKFFAELDLDALRPETTKMVFLVPPRLFADFAAITAKN